MERCGTDALLHDLHSYFTLLFRSFFADPYDTTLNYVQWIVVRDDLNNLAALQLEVSPQSETLLRAIDDEAGKPFMMSVSSATKDDTGGPLRGYALRAPALRASKAWHFFHRQPWQFC